MNARRASPWCLGLALLLVAARARAELSIAEPATPPLVPFPAGAPALEVQVVLALVVAASGQLESAIVVSHTPENAPALFDAAALELIRSTRFVPSQRDGSPFRSRIEYVVVFHPPPGQGAETGASPSSPALAPATASTPIVSDEPDEDYATIEVRGTHAAPPRGVGDMRIKRELLDAAPHQHTAELLSAAPGFFVDHEDGEGLGNDVYVRGFDLEHGSGLEMQVGNVPINSPVHVRGQGYADTNFIIPEVVRSLRVIEGPFDPRQGDAAMAGSVFFDLGVSERRHRLEVSYGSFEQARVVGVAAPAGFDEQTFVAFALRHSDGFGVARASQSGALNAQYGLNLGEDSHLRLLATAYSARSELPGVLRQADVDQGRIGFYDQYPYFSAQQGVQSSRVIASADFDTVTAGGTHFEFAPWAMWTQFLARQNFSGNVLSSVLDPSAPSGLGDLWESSNRESAFGLVSRLQLAPQRSGRLELSVEPGVSLRLGHTDQLQSLLNPRSLAVWDRRLNAGLDTLDAGAYLDAVLRLGRRARLSGGVRADLLGVAINDRLGYDVPPNPNAPSGLPGANRSSQGVALSPRLSAEYDVAPELSFVAAYGEGFRSLQASAHVAPSVAGPSLREGAAPYSKVRSYELGLRARTRDEGFSATCTAFATQVHDELVFEATSGGFTSEGASVRRGLVGSVLLKPLPWLLASLSGSVSEATFTTVTPGASRYVPNIPPLLLRADLSVHGALGALARQSVVGRLGFGYTFLAGRHITDDLVGPADHVLNGQAALRYRSWELSLEGYNLLALRYADDRQYFVSNWSLAPGPSEASAATHLSAAPPLALLMSLALFF